MTTATSLTLGTSALTFTTGSGADDVSVTSTAGDLTLVGNLTRDDNLALSAAGTITFSGLLPAAPFDVGTGSLTLIAGELDVVSGGGVADTIAGSGALTIRPNAPDLPVHLGGTTSAGGQFDLTAAELTAFRDGFSSITPRARRSPPRAPARSARRAVP